MHTKVFHMEREDEKEKRKKRMKGGAGKEMEIFHLIVYSSIVFVFAEVSNDDLPPLLDRCGID